MLGCLEHPLVSRKAWSNHKDMDSFQQRVDLIEGVRPDIIRGLLVLSCIGGTDLDMGMDNQIGRVGLDGCCCVLIANDMAQICTLINVKKKALGEVLCYKDAPKDVLLFDIACL